MAYGRIFESIGATARDFATVALWEAALPADLTAGDGQMRVGEMFDDANFTELGTTILGQTTNPNTPIILRAAAGESPVMRPTSGSAGHILFAGTQNLYIDGIEFVGNGGATISTALFNINSANKIHLQRCIFRNSPGIGLQVHNGDNYVLNCLAYDNTSHGFRKGGIVSSVFQNCGAFNNTGDGFSAAIASGVNSILLRGDWSLDNTGADIGAARDDVNTGWNFISDTSFTDLGVTLMKNNQESQSSAAMGFVNLSGRDFRLAIGSALRAKGVTFDAHRGTKGLYNHERWFDLDQLPMLNAKSDDPVDVGPYQSSYV